MAEKKISPLLLRLKNALAKLTGIILLQLGLCLAPRRPSRRLPSVSYDDGTVGLTSCLEDERIVGSKENCSARRLECASRFRYGNDEDDIDKRSQIFIDNFRRHLRLERQISLQLRYYYRASSSGTEDGESWPPHNSLAE